MTTVIQIQANLQWRAERGVHSDRWIGFCDPLGISAEATTLDELHTLIPEAIHILMLDLLEDNELDGFLMERGWSSMAHTVNAAAPATQPEFRVPWFLSIADAADGRARKAH